MILLIQPIIDQGVYKQRASSGVPNVLERNLESLIELRIRWIKESSIGSNDELLRTNKITTSVD